MILRGIQFGNVLGASGVQGFFGEGYWFHPLWRPFGLNFDGMTFVSKTVTLLAKEGNMPLTEQYTPRELVPKCIKVHPLSGIVLNAVGLSNPGLGEALNTKKWQSLKKPFWISIMPIQSTKEGRLEEIRLFKEEFIKCKEYFSAPFGLQVNISCPNVGIKPMNDAGEAIAFLDMLTVLKVPIMLKYSIASASRDMVLALNDHPGLDAICVSNSIPFGWQGIGKHVWKKNVSPLASLGGGGLSGKALRPLVCRWISRIRDAGFTKPINGGGGILCTNDVRHYNSAGASSIFLGSVATLRPWRVAKIIKLANKIDWI